MWKDQLVKGLAVAAIALLGLSAGLQARAAGLSWVWRRPGLLVRSLCTSVLVVPALVLLVVQLLPVPRVTGAALLTLAIVPAAPMVMGKSAKQGGQFEYAVSLEVTLLLLMVVTIPMLEFLLGLWFGRDFMVGTAQAIKQAFITQLIPLGVGFLIAWKWPSRASRWGELAGKIGLGVLMALVLVIVVVAAKAMVRLGAISYIAMALAASLSVLAGHTLGGPAPETRHTLAIFSALRHPGLAVLLATLALPGLKVAPAIVAYLIVSNVVLAIYHRLTVRSHEPQQKVLRPAPHRR